MKNKSKDILFMCQFFYPEYISSATLPFDTAQYLSKSGYKVGVLCGYPKEYSREQKVPNRECVDGIDIHRINYVQLSRRSIIGRIVNYFSLVAAFFFHMREVKEYKTIVIYSNPPLLPIVAKACKKRYKNKIIFVSYDVYPEIAIKTGMIREESFMAKFFRKMNLCFFDVVDRVIALSEDMKKFLVEERKIDPSKVHVIPNWYEDCAKKHLAKSAVTDAIQEDEFVLSYLGNLGTCQDADILVELAKNLKCDKKIRFIVAGHGNKMDGLQRRVEDEKLSNMSVLPFLVGDDYEAVLSRSDMFIVTLKEGLSGLCAPSKTYAYLMSGKPVIAAIDKEMEIAQDIKSWNAGMVVDDLNYSEIAEKIEEMKHDTILVREMGKNARKLFEDKYEKQICLEKYQEMVEETV